jgi:hypothetical protein
MYEYIQVKYDGSFFILKQSTPVSFAFATSQKSIVHYALNSEVLQAYVLTDF